MPDTRAGHHGSIVYVFEDQGFDTTPTDSTFKVFGGNATPDTTEGSHNAVRVFNADRKAAEIIRQTFDGSWSVTCDLTEPPWWLAALFGQPSSVETATTGLYDHTYSLSNGNDPVSLRLYMPTDGFSDYEMFAGAVIANVSVDQSQDGSPELTINGAYAREPVRQSTPSVSIPDFAESTFSNRHAELQVGGTTVGRAQNTTINLEANTELVGEIGSENAVDFVPKAWEPNATHDKILWVGQAVDQLQRFKDATQASVSLAYDNGATGTDQFAVDFEVVDGFPNDWSESGRNDPDADLMQELQEMGEDATVTVTQDVATPPGA